MPRQGSNLDSSGSNPEMLPITPQGIVIWMPGLGSNQPLCDSESQRLANRPPGNTSPPGRFRSDDLLFFKQALLPTELPGDKGERGI